jgi:hypothetical protein
VPGANLPQRHGKNRRGTMAATKKTKTAGKARIVDDMKVIVLKKENPFAEGTVQAKHAAAVLGSNGATVAAAKKKGADSWTIRQLVERKIVRVQQVEA